MPTKEFTRAIGYLAVLGLILITVISYMILDNLNSKLLQQQEKQFHIESQSKINTFRDRIENTTSNFKSYAHLPSFKAIRYYSLILNHLAVEENIRQLELFFFDLQNRDKYLLSVRYIDNDGNEIFNVDRSMIHSNLGNVLHDENTKHSLEQDLAPDEFHVDVIRDSLGNPETLQWWVPVYVSSTRRSGYLEFNVGISLIHNKMIDISDPGLAYVLISHKSDDLSQGEYQLASEPLPANFIREGIKWADSSWLPLIGLNWKIHIIGNTAVRTEGIATLRSAIKYGFIPAFILILVSLLYVFIQKIAADKHIHNLNRRLIHQEQYDSLTGVWSRDALEVQLTRLQTNVAPDQSHALLYIDLDQFKVINDTCGHTAGDELLRQVVYIFQHKIQDNDLLGRLGGDEFAVLLETCDTNRAVSIAHTILGSLSEFQFQWADKTFQVGASIGVVIITADNQHENIMAHADLACHIAKEAGRNKVRIYEGNDQIVKSHASQMDWLSRITQALEDDRFILYAQPIAPTHHDSLSKPSYELLVRIAEGENIIPPGEFLPAAERYNQIIAIDRWVVSKTIAMLENQATFLENIDHISINLSGQSLASKRFLKFLVDEIDRSNLQENICFEVTETAAINNLVTAIRSISILKGMGIRFSLDDFGSGLSSFAYLRTLDVDYLKIDGLFVKNIEDDLIDRAMVKSIYEIGTIMGKKIIAEFVENDGILSILSDIGVDYVQGYGVGKPEPFTEVIKNMGRL